MVLALLKWSCRCLLLAKRSEYRRPPLKRPLCTCCDGDVYPPVFVLAFVFFIALPESRAAITPDAAPASTNASTVQSSPAVSPRVGAPPVIGPAAAPASAASPTVPAPATPAAVSSPAADAKQLAAPPVPFPSPAPPPDAAELKAMLRTLADVPTVPLPRQPVAIALEDDTLTGGTWLGRRGRYWACLFAMVANNNYLWGEGWETVDSWDGIGPNARAGDSERNYVSHLYTTEQRSLEMPYPYLQTRVERKLTTWDVNRRQSEIDDHSETYPMTQDGPHLFENVRVPPGWYLLSLYDFNKDGHESNNRYRDYVISLRSRPFREMITSTRGFEESAELAHGRIHDFWGGVWVRFLVHGPAVYSVQVNRNYSFCTILAAAMLDTLDEMPPPYSGSPEEWLAGQNADRKRVWQAQAAGTWSRVPWGLSDAGLADLALERLERLRLANVPWWSANSRRFYLSLLRWYRALPVGPGRLRSKCLACLCTCFYHVGLYAAWEDSENKRGKTTCREVEQNLRLDAAGPNVLPVGSDHGYEILEDYLEMRPQTGR